MSSDKQAIPTAPPQARDIWLSLIRCRLPPAGVHSLIQPETDRRSVHCICQTPPWTKRNAWALRSVWSCCSLASASSAWAPTWSLWKAAVRSRCRPSSRTSWWQVASCCFWWAPSGPSATGWGAACTGRDATGDGAPRCTSTQWTGEADLSDTAGISSCLSLVLYQKLDSSYSHDFLINQTIS